MPAVFPMLVLDYQGRFAAGPRFGKVDALVAAGCIRLKVRPRDLGWPDWREGAYVRVRHMPRFDSALVITTLRDFCVARLAAEVDGREDTWLFAPDALLRRAPRLAPGAPIHSD